MANRICNKRHYLQASCRIWFFFGRTFIILAQAQAAERRSDAHAPGNGNGPFTDEVVQRNLGDALAPVDGADEAHKLQKWPQLQRHGMHAWVEEVGD